MPLRGLISILSLISGYTVLLYLMGGMTPDYPQLIERALRRQVLAAALQLLR